MVDVGLVQINNSFSGQNYLPYSVACLQSYARRKLAAPERFNFLPMLYKRMPIRDIVERLASADVAGFSTYVWNSQISLEAARRLKRNRPDLLVVFGGPHVPDHAEDFLRANPFIDIVVHNEGERTFTEILDRFPSRDWSGIRGVSYLAVDGQFVDTPPVERMRDLDELPSPFLSGIFDELMRANPHEEWIGLWETNRGCPFKCTFCDWGSATAAKVTKFELERLNGEIDWFASHRVKYIFVCDANFGIQKRDVEIAGYVAKVRKATGFPHGFSVQNTKNATERAYQSQKILADAKLNKGVALSMQSLDPTTLKNIKRDNISLETYFELARRFTADKVETYSDLILGLPGETYDSFCNGVDKLIRLGQHNRIQFNNCSILPNAEMGNPDYLRQFGMKTVRSEIINIHGSRDELDDDVPELQDLVIATDSMPPEDWRRSRMFSWMTAFLHFDKLFQLPLMVAHEMCGISYREIIEGFLNPGSGCEVIDEVRALFEREAHSIQRGGPEYVYADAWLGIYWPADEYMFIKLTVEEKLDRFYEEAGWLLARLVEPSLQVLAPAMRRLVEGAIADAVRLNAALVAKPFVRDDVRLAYRHNVLAFCDALRRGQPIALREEPGDVEIQRSKSSYSDLQDWCREVVWWGNKKGAYLYTNRLVPVEPELSGHY
jgi:radical SAM superfamily enzyme YgiQ (UPF0313 family)